ncbi:M3 family oligoendopeptidase [Ferroacidibacillus organovorans]|uniref:Oligoendopeptidase F n=1 Tax=Ferroacidibacillus organovorans TaxID=1765683 RepID=A0A124IVQ5_9BACL|nr:M3 family oligoendopeptidase [Ferroacidibacillus organovorans]KUO94999.1 oligoendopeptidase F [Ferroacidibacillus organovorans]
MGFASYLYQRPDMEETKHLFEERLEMFKASESATEAREAILALNAIRNAFDSMANLVYIRHSTDTNSQFYRDEQHFFDEFGPVMQSLTTAFYDALLESPHRAELENMLGRRVFLLADLQRKTFSPEVLLDLQKENELTTKYQEIVASAKISFDGKELNLAQFGPYTESPDRELRKAASEARFSFMAEHEEEFDSIFDQLVKLRHGMAVKLGFPSFTELSYARLNRTDYSQEDVKRFRDQVYREIVPIVEELTKRKMNRLHLDKLYYYDGAFSFATGNPTPKGTPEELVAHAKRMYAEQSDVTKAFFDFMIDNELMDLVTGPGKAAGGYCTYIPQYGAPFIFANFNGTSGDVDVLTHEAGHALQVFLSRDQVMPEYYWPSYEAAEIFSMSMEFFAWPWMDLFFKEDTDKYKFDHLSGALSFLPYGVAVDEFQHWIYANIDATPAMRKAMWRTIEKKYLPSRDYAGNAYLEQGGFWHIQSHIFGTPFYYIDYTLAQVCAFQYWQRSLEDRDTAFADYLAIARKGGSVSFTELVRDGKLKSPFAPNCLEEVSGAVRAWLDRMDDSAF